LSKNSGGYRLSQGYLIFEMELFRREGQIGARPAPNPGQGVRTVQQLHPTTSETGVVKKEKLLFIASEDGVAISLLPAVALATFG
jgi:hypothetical protein